RRVWGWMPYISATAEIMYAPLDLRLVMVGNCRHQFTSKHVGHGSSRIPRIQKAKSVFIRVNPWPTNLLRCGFWFLFCWSPSLGLQQMVDGIRHKAGRDQNHAEGERAHVP